MSTLRDLITGSFRLLGIVQQGESLSADDINVAVLSLSEMIDSWSNNKLLIYNYEPYEFQLTGAPSYTLGPGGDWNITRPMKIENAYARLNSGSQQQVDIAMQILTIHQYADISVKNTPSTFPFALYDDGNYPLRTITLFPIPTGPASIVLWLRAPLVDLTNLDQVVNFPPGYERAFRYNLAINIAPEFGKTVSPEINEIAVSSILALERLNQYPVYKVGDGGMTRNSNGKQFNWITGNFFSMR